jgi:FtsZ-interacting cell division protein YlmF
VDFVGGVVFALDGALKKTGRAVYVCSPVDIPLEELRVTALPRRTTVLDFGSAPEEAQQMAL